MTKQKMTKKVLLEDTRREYYSLTQTLKDLDPTSVEYEEVAARLKTLSETIKNLESEKDSKLGVFGTIGATIVTGLMTVGATLFTTRYVEKKKDERLSNVSKYEEEGIETKSSSKAVVRDACK